MKVFKRLSIVALLAVLAILGRAVVYGQGTTTIVKHEPRVVIDTTEYESNRSVILRRTETPGQIRMLQADGTGTPVDGGMVESWSVDELDRWRSVFGLPEVPADTGQQLVVWCVSEVRPAQ